MWRLAGCCPLGLGGVVTFFAATQRSAPATKIHVTWTRQQTVDHALHHILVQTHVYTALTRNRTLELKCATARRDIHSFIQQCHSARAARARTVTRETHHTRCTSSHLFSNVSPARFAPSSLAFCSSRHAYLYVTYVRWWFTHFFLCVVWSCCT